MPVCTCCGDTDFDLVDGLFYCSTCQTQTQDVQEEQMEDDNFMSGAYIRKEKSTRHAQCKVIDKGRPWETYEGFQIIIREQVKSLINLGAKPELEDLVFRLWALYLSKTGIAFTDKSDTEKMFSSTKHARLRDKYPGTVEDPEIVPIRYRRTYKKNHMESRQDMTDRTFADETFFECDDPAEQLKAAEMSSESGSDDDSGKDNQVGKIKRKKVLSVKALHDRPGWMKMIRTVGFCYLGLIYTNSFTTPAEIVRWIRNGKLPYKNATALFPDDMKIGPNDRNTFWAEIPSTYLLREETGRLAYFLGIREYPPFPVKELISRYILQLELPAEMHGLVARLVSQQRLFVKYKLNFQKKIIPHYEAMAIAHVIILLKLLFGLDDHTERQLSEYGRELMQVIGGNHRLFVWDDWMMYIGKKFAESKTKNFIFGRSDIRDIRNVNIFLEQYQLLSRKQGKFSRKRDHRDKKFQKQTREDIQKPFSSLLEKWEDEIPDYTSASKNLLSEVTSETEVYDPSSIATIFEEDLLGFLLSHDQETSKAKSDSKPNHFRDSTIKYITQPETFLDDLDKQGLSDYTIYSSCKSSSSEDSDDLLPDDDNSSLRRKKMRRKNLSASFAVVRHAVSEKKNTTPSKHQIRNKSRFEELIKKLLRAHENYIVYKSPTFQRHRSYHWLLSVCSNLIECDPERLDEEVKKLQMVYFLDEKNLNCSEILSLRWLKRSSFLEVAVH